MRTYTESSTPSQDVIDSVDIRHYATEICPAWEVRSFLDSIPEPASVTAARWDIIQAYESGAIGAVEALNALEAHGCLTDPDDFMQSFVAGSKVRLQLGDETPPESPHVHTGSAQGVRVTSHAPAMLEALAEARSGRNAA